MTWVVIPDSDIDPDSPITTGLMTALRNNVASAFAKDSGAPVLANDYIVNAMINTGAVNADSISGSDISTRVLIDTYIASASATIDCVSDITSAYDNYEIVFDNIVPATNAVQLSMVISSNNGSSYLTASGYYYTRAELSEAAWIIAEGSNSTSFGPTGATISNSSTRGGVNGVIRLFNPLPSAVHQFDADLTYAGTINAVKAVKLSAVCTYNATVVCNAIRFKFSSGNIASGTIKIYGIIN